MMGVIPYLQPEKLKLQIDPILNYLALKLNRQIKLTTVSDYEGLGRLLELNRIQIALFSDTSYRKLKKDNAWEVLCRPVQYGSVVYRGQIIARKNSEIDSLEKLRGKRFAYVDRYSGSGFFYPNLLLKEKNIRKAIEAVFLAYCQDNTMGRQCFQPICLNLKLKAKKPSSKLWPELNLFLMILS
jgi:phosphonate transport system substrate-binding protein